MSSHSLAADAAVASPSTGVILRRILALAAPTSLVAALQVISQLAETWLAARQGTAALAGWAVVLPFALLLQQMSAGAMGGGVVSAIARALGAGRRDEASALVLHALLIALAAGSLFALALAGFPRAVLGFVGGREAAEAAALYSPSCSASARSRPGSRTPSPRCCAAAAGTRSRRGRSRSPGSSIRASPGR